MQHDGQAPQNDSSGGRQVPGAMQGRVQPGTPGSLLSHGAGLNEGAQRTTHNVCGVLVLS